VEGLAKLLKENNSLDLPKLKEEIKVIHEFINKTKQLDRLERNCFGLFSKIFGRSRSDQIEKTAQKLFFLSDTINLKFLTRLNSKLLILDKNKDFDILILKRGGILNIARDFSSIETELKKEIKHLPLIDQELAIKKMAILSEMVTYASALKNDSFKPDIIEKLTIYRLELKNEGISGSFPSKIEVAQDNPDAAEKGLIVDSKGNAFDNLRQIKNKNEYVQGGDSSTEKFATFCESKGGDYGVIRGWYKQQAKDSWHPKPTRVKNTLSSFRNVTQNKIWGGPQANIKQQKAMSEKERETLLMFMAFTTELLTRTDFPGKNSDGTITIFRTESKAVLEMNGINNVSSTKEHIMNRGFAESGSIIAPVMAYGAEVTEQRLPIHRVVGTFFTERLFNSDREKEFICMFDDITFKYTKSLTPSTTML